MVQGRSFDEEPIPGLNTEALGFRSASECFASRWKVSEAQPTYGFASVPRLLARGCSFILIVPLAFNFCPEPGAGLGSETFQVILQFLGICSDSLLLNLLGGLPPLVVEGEEHYSIFPKP